MGNSSAQQQTKVKPKVFQWIRKWGNKIWFFFQGLDDFVAKGIWMNWNWNWKHKKAKKGEMEKSFYFLVNVKE